MIKATFRNQNVQAELTRILRREMRKIVGCLKGLPAAAPEGIGEAGQRFRRLRALNQLVQPSHRRFYRFNDRIYRSLTAMLNGEDDLQLMHSALQFLLFERPDLVRDPVTCLLLESCAGEEDDRQRVTLEKSTLSVGKVIRHRLAEHLSGKRYVPPTDFAEPDLMAGVRANYFRCRKQAKKALVTGDPSSSGCWNFFVENHFYQLGALACPDDTLVQQQRDAGKLSELLNRDYRLALLRERLRQVKTGNPQLLLDAIIDERQLCRLEMEILGEQLFATEADAFTEQLQVAWKQRWS